VRALPENAGAVIGSHVHRDRLGPVRRDARAMHQRLLDPRVQEARVGEEDGLALPIGGEARQQLPDQCLLPPASVMNQPRIRENESAQNMSI